MATKPTTLHESFLAAQTEFPEIAKDGKADAGKFSYRYATLPSILRVILPVLHKYSLSFTQTFDKDGMLTTTIRHALTGEAMISVMPMPTAHQLKPQEFGSLISYLRRYSAISILGLAPEDDLDAADVPIPALPPEALMSPKQQTAERLIAEDRDLIKAWSLEPLTTKKSALKAVGDLIEVVMDEAGEDSNLYKLTRQRMNTVIDERVSDG